MVVRGAEASVVVLIRKLVLAIAVFFAPMGQTQGLLTLNTLDEAEAWQAVGRLNLGRFGMCTGALIAPDQVLTAAHCLYDENTGQPISASDVTFLAGWRNGRAAAEREASRIVIHKDYRPNLPLRQAVSVDIALVELTNSIGFNAAKPFELEEQPSIGRELTVVSYAQNRSEAPSIESGCRVLDRTARVITANCDVDFGASGSPMFIVQRGVPRIASVVSAMAKTDEDEKYSIGVALGAPLEELRKQLEFDNNVFQRKSPGAGSIAQQLGRN